MKLLVSNLVDLLNRSFNFKERFSQRRTEIYKFWHSLPQCSGHEPQEILGRTKFCCVEKSFLIPDFALFARQQLTLLFLGNRSRSIVAAYIESHKGLAATIKQDMAAIRMMFSCLTE
jgi:hypothetical protein